MRLEDIKVDDKVVYIPDYLFMGDKTEMVKDENLGIVTSMNDTFVFVRYLGKNNSQATRAEDLYSIKNRPDLIEKL
jgi:hypothetical protein